jgi:hypothetical protein
MEQGGSFQVGIVVMKLAPMVDLYEGLLGFEPASLLDSGIVNDVPGRTVCQREARRVGQLG